MKIKINQKSLAKFSLLFFSLFFIVTWIFLSPREDAKAQENGGTLKTIAKGASWEQSCVPITTTEEICYQNYCVDYNTSENGTVYCVDMRENYCRNNTVTRQKCSRTLYSGQVNYFNGTEYEKINTTITSNPSSEPLYDYGVETGAYFAFFKQDPSTADSVKFYYNQSFMKGKNPHKSGFVTYQPMSLNYRNDLDQIQQINITQPVTGFPQNNKFIYPDVFGFSTNLTYEYGEEILKEKLIIENISKLPKPEQYIIDGGNATIDLDFLITWKDGIDIYIDGVLWDKSSTKETQDRVDFKLNGETLFFLSKPYAYDSLNKQTELTYQFKKSGNKLYVIVKTNYTWLNSSERVYPIEIDPTVQLQEADSENIEDSYVWSNQTDKSYGASNIFYIGLYKNSSSVNFARAFILWNLSTIPSEGNIINANLSLNWTGGYSSGFDISYVAYNTSNSWTEENITWNNQPSASILQDNITIVGGSPINTRWYWNLTDATKHQHSQSNKNLSVMIKIDSENGTVENYRVFPTKENTNILDRPYLNITYIGGTYDISDCTVLDGTGTTYYLDSDITDSSTSNCMDITANNVTLDCQGYLIDSDGSTADYGITVGADDATIINCTLTDWDTGQIYINQADNVNITNSNTTVGQDWGIYNYRSSGGNVENTYSQNNEDWDVYFSLNSRGQCDWTLSDVNGTDNKLILLYNDTTTIDGWDNNVSELIFCDSNDTIINDLTLNRASKINNGILLFYSDNITLHNSSIKDVEYGIYAFTVTEMDMRNMIINNTDASAAFVNKGNNWVIDNLTAKYSSDVLLDFVSDTDYVTISNSVISNTLTSNDDGIYNYAGEHWIIDNVNISDIAVGTGAGYGIWVSASLASEDSSNVTIKNSRIENTGDYSISLSGNGFDVFNNFINNSLTVTVSLGSNRGNYRFNTTKQTGTRIYSSGNRIGGNYYTNSTGNDFSDTCSDSDRDGFCDSAYDVSNLVACEVESSCNPNSTDYLPLSDEFYDTPLWSNNQSSTPSSYSPTTPSKFNITWSDGGDNVDVVFIEINSTNYTATNSYGGDVYNLSIVLSAGAHSWKSYANDTEGNSNTTDKWYFTLNKKSAYIVLEFDKSSPITYGTQLNATCYDPSETTVSLQLADVENFEDAFVYDGNPNTNYGSQGDLDAGYSSSSGGTWYRSYIKFNNSIPYGSTIINATLYLYKTTQISDTNNITSVYHVYNQTWTEDAITWNNQPCGTNFDDSVQCNLTEYSNYTSVGSTNLWVSWNVTGAVDYDVNSDNDNISFSIKYFTESSCGGSWCWSAYASKEYSTTQYRPILEVTYIHKTIDTSNVLLYRNGTDVNSSENFKLKELAVGTYIYTCNLTDTQNYTGTNQSATFIINKAPPNLLLSNNVSWTTTYGIATNTTGYNCPSQLTCNLYRDDGSVSNPEEILLGAGNYNYTYNTTGNQNYTSNSTSNILTISKSSAITITLLLNDSDSDISVNRTEIVNLTAYASGYSYDITVYLDMNATGYGDDFESGTNSVENLTDTTDFSEGKYNVTGHFNGDENYSSSSSTHYLTVSENIPTYSNLIVSPTSPTKYAPNKAYQFNSTWSQEDVVFMEWNGTGNYTATEEGVEYYVDLNDLASGDYTYRWLANNSADSWTTTSSYDYEIQDYPRWSNNTSTTPIQYNPKNSTFNITWSLNKSEVSLSLLEINTTNYTMSNQSNEYYYRIVLGRGYYEWRIFANSTEDYWNVSDQWSFTISQNTTNPIHINFTYSGTTYTDQNLSTYSDVTINTTPYSEFDNSGTLTLYYDDNSVSLPHTTTHGVGTHNYTTVSSGNINYTPNSTGISYFLSISTRPEEGIGTGGGPPTEAEAECGNGYCEYGEDEFNCPKDCIPKVGNATFTVSRTVIRDFTRRNHTYREEVIIYNPQTEEISVKAQIVCVKNDKLCQWTRIIFNNTEYESYTFRVPMGSEKAPGSLEFEILIKTPDDVSMENYKSNLVMESSGIKRIIPIQLYSFEIVSVWIYGGKYLLELLNKMIIPFAKPVPYVGYGIRVFVLIIGMLAFGLGVLIYVWWKRRKSKVRWRA